MQRRFSTLLALTLLHTAGATWFTQYLKLGYPSLPIDVNLKKRCAKNWKEKD